MDLRRKVTLSLSLASFVTLGLILTACAIDDGSGSPFTINTASGASGGSGGDGGDAAGSAGATASAPPLQSLILPGSRWGGQGVSLVVNGVGAIVKWSCAEATLLQPISLDQNNRFEVSGIYTTKADRRAHPMQLLGRVDPVTLVMSLSVLLTDRFKNQTQGSWDLIYSRNVTVPRCPR